MRQAPLLLLALLAAGCGGLSTGPVERPDLYPDRRTPAATWHTWLWARKTGDVDVLREVCVWRMRDALERELNRSVPEPNATSFKAEPDLRVLELEWTKEAPSLAYLRAVLGWDEVPRAELDFAFALAPDGWVISASRWRR